jgi:hypothetical protein
MKKALICLQSTTSRPRLGRGGIAGCSLNFDAGLVAAMRAVELPCGRLSSALGLIVPAVYTL